MTNNSSSVPFNHMKKKIEADLLYRKIIIATIHIWLHGTEEEVYLKRCFLKPETLTNLTSSPKIDIRYTSM